MNSSENNSVLDGRGRIKKKEIENPYELERDKVGQRTIEHFFEFIFILIYIYNYYYLYECHLFFILFDFTK